MSIFLWSTHYQLSLSDLSSSWRPMAMPGPEPFLRKQFQCTTIGLRRMTAGECLSQLFLDNFVIVKSLVITCADCWHWKKENKIIKKKPTHRSTSNVVVLMNRLWHCIEDICLWITACYVSSGFGLSTKGWNSRGKPSIHLFHTPQVRFSHMLVPHA